jgi:SRSO17 transposase
MVTAASQIETSEPLLLSPSDLREAITELQEYHAIYAPLFTRREQREWAELYLRGLVSPDIGRKSIEPMILAIKGVDGNTIRAVQQFTGAGGWDDGIILKRHWQEVQVTLGEDDGVLVTDGSDFRKQGIESVGVKRQYCGELGKRANCQAGVFLGYVSSKGYTLLDRRLYLPEEWITGPEYAERRKKCGIPKDIDFQTKNELAWNMIESVHREGTLRCRWATFDEAFGRDTAFLDRIAGIKLWYLAEVPKDTQVWMDRPRTEIPAWKGRGPKPQRPIIVEGQPPARTVTEIAESLPPGLWIRHLIKEGSKGPMMADFVSLRVVGMRDSLPGPDVWLVLRRSLATGEIKFYLSNAPADTPLPTLVRISGMRWPIETCFEEGKQHLGMGDYEVRTWKGWHHHMTLCILAHHFLVRVQHKYKKNSGADPAPDYPVAFGCVAPARL